MAALGFTINTTTMFGIVLAIGIVVDDAIVIVEGVAHHIERGMTPHDASIKAMDELFGPVIGITLVLMSVFLPAAFLPGLTGQMFAQFALVICRDGADQRHQCRYPEAHPVRDVAAVGATPPEKRNIFFRGFNKVYGKLEDAYAAPGRLRWSTGPDSWFCLALVAGRHRRLGCRPPADGLHSQRGPGLPDDRRAAAGRRLARAYRRHARLR